VRLLDRRHAVGMCRKCADHSLHRRTRYIAAGVV
jgi:ribosomal protein L37E